MAKQAVELEDPEVALVASGNTDTDAERSTLLTRATGDGEVIERNGAMGVLYNDGKFVKFPEAISGMNHVVISHERQVKPGDKITRGQKLTVASVASQGYKLGKNANVFYINYLGRTYEDGVVISQSFADQMAHWTIHNVAIEVKTGEVLQDIQMYTGMVVNSNDRIASLCSGFRMPDGKISTIKDIHSDEVQFKEYPQLIPANIDHGYVIGMEWQHNKDLKKLKDTYRNQVIVQAGEETEANLAEWRDKNKDADKSELKNVPDRYRNQSIEPYDFGKLVQETSDRKIIHDVLVLKIAVRRPISLGDKVCNRYGSKGMISCILPDDCRPWYEDENGTRHYADIVANSASIISRKNVSQLHEALLSRALDVLRDETIKAVKNKDNDKLHQILEIVHQVYGKQHADLDMKGLFAMAAARRDAWSINVGTYHKEAYTYVQNIVDTVSQLRSIRESEEVYVPSVSMLEATGQTEDGKEMFGFQVKSIDDGQPGFRGGDDYELGWLDDEIVVGVNYYYCLYKGATWDASATSGMGVPRKGGTLLGKAKTRSTGQNLGEYESWALHATGADELIKKQAPTMNQRPYELWGSLFAMGIELKPE